MSATRQLVLVLGDQLDRDSLAFHGFDAQLDRVLMIEAASEATHVWSHKQRIAIFLSAMRHFAARLVADGIPIDYVRLAQAGGHSLPNILARELQRLHPQVLVAVLPGEFRVLHEVSAVCERSGVPLDLRQDHHFYCTPNEFANWAAGLRELRLENFYRRQRRAIGVLVQAGTPEGGRWNFDAENRRGFGKSGPGTLPAPRRFEPDEITRSVLKEVAQRFPNHPGRLTSFAWPVTREDAQAALADFIAHRLPHFGRYQDAMWRGEPWLYHSLLSAALNLKLLNARESVGAALAAYRASAAPLAAVEGFVRQILGWREFIRGVYWLDMPAMAQANYFDHTRALPRWYWSGATQMACLREAITQTLEHGYAHHIQRLMLTGMFCLLAEIEPKQVADWYLAVYVDAVEWVELPNVIGMALYADGGRFTSKPYVASGAYVNRMSNYCAGCCYEPNVKRGVRACPLNVLYWRFLGKHEKRFAARPRTSLMVRKLSSWSDEERAAVRSEGDRLLAQIESL